MSSTRIKDILVHNPEIWDPLIPCDGKDDQADAAMANSLYHVIIRKMGPDLVHLSIKRHDRKPVKNWRHFQYIKNQICGEESFGFEVYPPESKLVDTANQYHLWVTAGSVMPDFCFDVRLVAEEPAIKGAVQEPWETNMRPKDLLSPEDFIKYAEKLGQEDK